ncbi:YhcN/YlaJ family sporulation lipoprotein [Paenibacillus solisilvae]|uniref:YhcN/YlaJ family sporulation lipoprotein n=1 Tax=Paenibacillus solisilvae TaxID=2486751 RepID=A0ABW0W8Y6_9BACL
MNIIKKMLMVSIISLILVATGCTNNPNNQTKQQNVRDNQQILRNQNVDNNVNRPNRGLTDGDDRIEVADRAAENITKLKGVRSANVLVTRQNAYVAAALDNDQNKMTQDIEDQIAKQVRATDANIKNVYVSTNPQFVDRINMYINDVQEGRPVAGFVEQFNDMISRIFPNAR